MHIHARGLEGQMTFDGLNVTITRRGLLPFLFHGAGGTKTIPLHSISAVQHRRCGMHHGYLQLTVAGELPQGNSHGRDQSMSKDENAVVFYFRGNRSFDELATALRAAVSDVHLRRYQPDSLARAASSSPPVPAATTPPSSKSLFAQIEDLARVRDAGHLTDAEFSAKKSELLNRI